MTADKDPILNVAVLVVPTGEALWMETGQYRPGYLREIVDAWKKQHPGIDGSMGIVEIKMPLSQYKKIPANNSFDWPCPRMT